MATYSWSYAPTNRAGCKGKCKEKIAKGAVRLGVSTDGPGDYTMVQYRCLDCVTDKQVANIAKAVGGLENVDGFHAMSPSDQKRITLLGKAPCGEGSATGSAGSKAEGKAKAKAKGKVAAEKATAKPRGAAAKAKAEVAKATPAKRKASPPTRGIPEDEQHKFLDEAKNRDFEKIRKLVEAKPGLVNVQPAGRWSALHQFAQAGHADAVKFLLSRGADRDAKTKDGQRPKDIATGPCVALLAETIDTLFGPPSDEEMDEEDEEDIEEEGEEEDDEEASAPPPAVVPAAAKPAPTRAKAAAASSSSAPATAVAGESPTKRPRREGRAVDPSLTISGLKVIDDYAVKLNQTHIDANNNKFYIIQALEGGGKFYAWTRWGRVGEVGANKLEPKDTRDAAIKEFEKKFREKTGNAFSSITDFKPISGKYSLVETEDAEGGGQDAPMGKLTEAQIGKGQKVLDQVETSLGKPGSVTRTKELEVLSSEFYTLIPHNFGRTRPPAILTTDMLQAKVELLKFYLRMGFEKVEEDTGATPIAGVMDLPLPESLSQACAGVCGQGFIKSSTMQGEQLAKKQVGNPTKAMTAALYGAIMLYTSNAIYKQINQALRDENRSKIKQYFNYLRLFLEALERLPKQERTLWRGLGIDLFDNPQYKVGNVITWWGISSTTSDINVAKNFAKGCGGKCSVLTIKATTSSDISDITFFSKEKESLLAPGTKLEVKSKRRNGNVAEIELEEVGRALG